MLLVKLSANTKNSFVVVIKLQILDLSGNSDMKELPKGLLNASMLQVFVLDGCIGLENVYAPNELPSSIISFSLDSYGPASCWTSTTELPLRSFRPERPSEQDNKDVKTLKISLQGCTQLTNLFLRELSNLLESDLLGSALKVLDFESMVVDVPRLKRLFMLGCERLRAIKSGDFEQLHLELICIDTWPGTWTQPLHVQHEPSRIQVHAVLADVRLARSLWDLISWKIRVEELNVCFDIHASSCGVVHGEAIQ